MDINEVSNVLSVTYYNAFMITSIDAFVGTLEPARGSRLSLLSEDNLNKKGAKRGGRIPGFPSLGLRRRSPMTCGSLRDAIKIFQNICNVELISVIKEVSFLLNDSKKQRLRNELRLYEKWFPDPTSG